MKPRNAARNPEPSAAPPRRSRFRIDKLEERIAPKKGGNGTQKWCATFNCGDSYGGSSY